MRILESASCIAVIVSLMIAAVRATNTDDYDGIFALEKRHRRAVVATLNYNGCGHWSDWISQNTPNVSSSPNEIEYFTEDDLDVLCPFAGGNTIKGFCCIDENGQPIHDIINKTDASNTYVFTCSNMYATCFMINASNTIKQCPDYAIQIKCDCPPTTSPSGTTKHTTSGTGGGSFTGNGDSGSGNSGELVTGSGSSVSGTGGGSVTGSCSGGNSTVGGSVTGSGTDGSGTGTGGISRTGNDAGESGDASGIGGNTSGTRSNILENPKCLCGSFSVDGNLSLAGICLLWWLIPLFVSFVLFVVHLILVMCVYNKLKQQIRNNKVGTL